MLLIVCIPCPRARRVRFTQDNNCCYFLYVPRVYRKERSTAVAVVGVFNRRSTVPEASRCLHFPRNHQAVLQAIERTSWRGSCTPAAALRVQVGTALSLGQAGRDVVQVFRILFCNFHLRCSQLHSRLQKPSTFSSMTNYPFSLASTSSTCHLYLARLWFTPTAHSSRTAGQIK